MSPAVPDAQPAASPEEAVQVVQAAPDPAPADDSQQF
jgi:hypothetical protein